MQTHIYGIPLEDAELQKELQFDLPLLEELLHLCLSLVQLLEDALNVVNGTVVGCLVAGDGRVPGTEMHIQAISSKMQCCALKTRQKTTIKIVLGVCQADLLLNSTACSGKSVD